MKNIRWVIIMGFLGCLIVSGLPLCSIYGESNYDVEKGTIGAVVVGGTPEAATFATADGRTVSVENYDGTMTVVGKDVLDDLGNKLIENGRVTEYGASVLRVTGGTEEMRLDTRVAQDSIAVFRVAPSVPVTEGAAEY